MSAIPSPSSSPTRATPARDAAERVVGGLPTACRRWSTRRPRSPPARRTCGTKRRAISPTASRRATRRRSRRPSPARRTCVELELVNNRLIVVSDRAARRDRRYDAQHGFAPACSPAPACTACDAARRRPCSTCRPSACACARPMSAAASASRTRSIPNGCCCCGPRGIWAARSNGSPSAARISSARRRAATTTRAARLALDADGTVSRARCRHGRRSRRLSVDRRPGQLDQRAGERDGRGLRDPGGVHGRARRLHQHRADRRLSRRRQARSQLPDRAAGRRAPRAAGPRPDRAAPAQPDRRISRIAARSAPRSIAAASPPTSTTWRGCRRPRGLCRRAGKLPRARGRLRGLGVACFSKPRAARRTSAPKSASNRTARVALVVGTQSNGMGHETAYPQIAADLLGLPIAAFRYVQADTAQVATGNGHGGARSMHMGGTALVHGGRHGAGEGPRARRAAAAGRSRTSELLRRPVHCRDGRRPRHRPAGLASRRATPPTCRTAMTRLDRRRLQYLRRLHFPQRLPRRRSRDRSRNRRA